MTHRIHISCIVPSVIAALIKCACQRDTYNKQWLGHSILGAIIGAFVGVLVAAFAVPPSESDF